MRKLLIPFLLLFSIQLIHAQDNLPFKWGKVTLQDFEVTANSFDSNYNAIVVADVGETFFVAKRDQQKFAYTFTRKKRIKIVNKNGYDAATNFVYLFHNTNGREECEYLKAYTYNLENGKVVQTKLESNQVFDEKSSKNWDTKKFTFPNIKEGSILEFSLMYNFRFFI